MLGLICWELYIGSIHWNDLTDNSNDTILPESRNNMDYPDLMAFGYWFLGQLPVDTATYNYGVRALHVDAKEEDMFAMYRDWEEKKEIHHAKLHAFMSSRIKKIVGVDKEEISPAVNIQFHEAEKKESIDVGCLEEVLMNSLCISTDTKGKTKAKSRVSKKKEEDEAYEDNEEDD